VPFEIIALRLTVALPDVLFSYGTTHLIFSPDFAVADLRPPGASDEAAVAPLTVSVPVTEMDEMAVDAAFEK
jgi:hypothetical protein